MSGFDGAITIRVAFLRASIVSGVGKDSDAPLKEMERTATPW